MLPNFDRLGLVALATGTNGSGPSSPKRRAVLEAHDSDGEEEAEQPNGGSAVDAVLATPDLVQHIWNLLGDGDIASACNAAQNWCNANKAHPSICDDENATGWTMITYKVFRQAARDAMGMGWTGRERGWGPSGPPAPYTRKGWFLFLCNRWGMVLGAMKREAFVSEKFKDVANLMQKPEAERKELALTPGKLSEEQARRLRRLDEKLDRMRASLIDLKHQKRNLEGRITRMRRDLFIPQSIWFTLGSADARRYDDQIFGRGR